MIEIRHDTIPEANEMFDISITHASSPAILPPATPRITVTIEDDDGPAGSRSAAITTSAAIQTTSASTPGAPLVSELSPTRGSFPIADTSSGQRSQERGSANQASIENATVFLDLNFNGVLDFLDINSDGMLDDNDVVEPSTQTAIDGSFGIEFDESLDHDSNGAIDTNDGRWVLNGGTEIATGLPWRTKLTSPIGLFSITPLTTLVESLVRTQAMTVPEAMTRTTEAFGIPNYDLATGNSLYEVLAYDNLAALAYKAHVKLYSAILQVSELLAGSTDLPVDYFASRAFDRIAAIIQQPGTTLDLSNAAIVEGVLRSIIELEAVTGIGDAKVSGASNIIADSVHRVDQVELTAFASGQQFLLQINRVKKVVQGAVPTAFFQVGAGTQSIETAMANLTGTALDDLINAETASVVVPPAISINSLSMLESEVGMPLLRFSLSIVGEHNYPVSIDYATVAESAITGEDFTAKNGTITWNANDLSVKFIDISIHGDTLFEPDESFKILLSNPVGVVARVVEGTGVILNDDLPAAITSTQTGSANAIYYQVSSGSAGLYENGVEKLFGSFVEPLNLQVNGQDSVHDKLTVDFSANTYRADTLTFDGKTGVDTFHAIAGVFSEVDHSIVFNDSGRTVFVPGDAARRLTLNSSRLETINLDVSSMETLTIRVPDSIAEVILEDANPAEVGRQRIRSATGQFAPIEFVNPSGRIRFLKDSSATVVNYDANNLDVGFTGVVEVENSTLEIVDILVRGASWPSTVSSFSFIHGDSPTLPLPWVNLNQFEIIFSHPIAPPALDAIKLNRVTDATALVPSSVQAGSVANSWVWTFENLLITDRYRLIVSGESGDANPITSQSNRLLNNGSDATRLFDVVHGDVNRNGRTTVGDLVALSSTVTAGTESSIAIPHDVNGSGRVTNGDLVAVSNAVGAEIPDGSPPSNLIAKRLGPDGSAHSSLDDLDSIVEAAFSRLQASGVAAEEINWLREGATITFADLDGRQLAAARGMTIEIDNDAAGWGWFVDRTPQDDLEFRRGRNVDELFAHSRSDARQYIDLLTVVMHELGHLLGLETNEDGTGLMQETLTPGVRRQLGTLDEVFSNWGFEIPERDRIGIEVQALRTATRLPFVDRL